MRTPLK